MGIFRRLSLLVVAWGLAALTMAPAALAENQNCTEAYSATPGALLLNPNAGFSPSEVTVPLAVPIPAGDYSLTMVSFDEHDKKPVDQSDQVNE